MGWNSLPIARSFVGLGVLVLIPGLTLGYVGLRGLADREATLRTTLTSTAALVRDRLAAVLAAREQALGSDAGRLAVTAGPRLEDPQVAREWLETVSRDHAWIARPFLHDGMGIVTGAVWVAWNHNRGAPLGVHPVAADLVRQAEQAEFVRGELPVALRLYRGAADVVPPRSVAHAFLITRIGRTLLKLRRIDEAIQEYRHVAAVAVGETDANGWPFSVIAWMQIIEGSSALGRAADAAAARHALLTYAVRHPWDVADGYAVHLRRALNSSAVDPALVREAQRALHDSSYAEWLMEAVVPSMRNATDAAQHLATQIGDAQTTLAHRRIPGLSKDRPLVLGYEIPPEFVRTELLPHILDGTPLPSNVRVGLRAAGGGPASVLAESALGGALPGWRITVEDKAERAIAQIVARERWIYGTLVAGMVFVMLGGVYFTGRAAARAAELARVRSEFVSNVSHELKTPLALIRLFGETLESGLVADSARRQECYGVIRRESERLTHLINNVLDIGRIDAGKKHYALGRGDLALAVRQALDGYRPLFDRLGFEVHTALAEDVVEIDMDRDAIVQALINLFQNAIKYCGGRRFISVSLERTAGEARLTVADRGVGIAPEHVERIFDPYFRVPADPRVATSGSGLGLSIVRHVMEAHRGRVEVISTPGRGSIFTFVFPLLPDAPRVGP